MSYEGSGAMVGGDTSGGGGIQLSSTQITYALVITVGTLLLITVFLFISIVCLRRRYLLSMGSGAVNANMMTLGGGGGGGGGGVGMGRAALEACPKMSYRWEKLFRTRSEAERRGCCAICLSDYCHDRDCDRECVRLIPDCGHVFHADCVDQWLLAHATCPVCRTSPLPDHAGLGLGPGDVLSRSP